MVTHAGYKAKENTDGSLTVYGVPIFVECARGEHEFDTDWINEAVSSAHKAAQDGYYPPLHIRHHEPGDPSDAVKAAGYFQVTGAELISFKGKSSLAIMANLVITDPSAQGDILAKRLPYRSVEIFNVDEPKIDSVALLDHEAPYLELPMLMIADTGTDAPVMASTIMKNIWLGADAEPASMCFRRGNSALFFQKVDEMPKEKMVFKDDEEKKKYDGKEEDMAADEGGMDVSSVVKAIESGEISVADMDAIVAAISSQKSESVEEEETPTKPTPAPAAAPGEAMSAELAKLQGKLEATEARLNERDKEDMRRTDIAEAMQRLDGRPLGAGLEGRLVKFHKNHGSDAFKAYTESMAETFGQVVDDDTSAAAFLGQSATAPDAAMKYQSEGVEAVENAGNFSREWKELHDRHQTNMSEERYVALNMARIGIELKKEGK